MGADHDDGGAPGSTDEVGDGVGPRVRRERTVARSRWRPVVVASSLLVLLCAGLLAWKPWGGSGTGPGTAAATTTPSDVVDDEGVPVGIGTTAPLTGIPVDEIDAARLLRPALVAKIDGAPEAMPQEGLEKADLVMEVRVEGISRYLGQPSPVKRWLVRLFVRKLELHERLAEVGRLVRPRHAARPPV